MKKELSRFSGLKLRGEMDFLGRESNSSILALLQLLYIGYPNKDVKLIVKYTSLDHRLDVWVEDPLKGFEVAKNAGRSSGEGDPVDCK